MSIETRGRSRVSRREFLALGGAGLALVAAGSACTQLGIGGEPKTINVGQWGTAQRAELYKQAIEVFQQQNAGVTAPLQFAELAAYNDRLVTQAASKSLPDVLWMRDDRIGRFGASGALLDLTPYLDKGLNTKTLGPVAVSDGTVGKGVYGLTSHYVGQSVIVNAPFLKEKGINYEQQVKSWDDLAALAKQLADPNRKFWGMADPTMGTTQRHLQAWIRQSGQELFTPDGQIGFTTEVFGAWLNLWDKLRKDQVIPPPDVQTQADAGGFATNQLVTNQVPIALASTNGLTQIQRLTQTPMAMFSIPEIANGSKDWWYFPPILLSIAANTKSPHLSVSLIEFFLNSVPAGKITKVDQGAPSSAPVREAIAPELQPAEAAFVNQISREMTYPARPLPVLPAASTVIVKAQSDAGQRVAYGKETVSQAAASFMAEAKKAIAAS
ncbi:MAG: extracellular solute-binding protein [Chloroflexota bacterium]